MKENNNHPYYNRPSLHTSYQIAVIALIGLVLTVLGLMVSEVVSDFDYTSINRKEDPIADTFIKRETIEEKMLIQMKARMMKGSVLRVINE